MDDIPDANILIFSDNPPSGTSKPEIIVDIFVIAAASLFASVPTLPVSVLTFVVSVATFVIAVLIIGKRAAISSGLRPSIALEIACAVNPSGFFACSIKLLIAALTAGDTSFDDASKD